MNRPGRCLGPPPVASSDIALTALGSYVVFAAVFAILERRAAVAPA